MTGIIVTTPPAVELPPGNAGAGPNPLPPVTYQFVMASVPQTWTALQTFTAGITVNGPTTLTSPTINSATLNSATLNSPTITSPTGIAFSNISGSIAVSQMNGGASASSSTFFRGDGVWAVPSSSAGTVTNVATGAGLVGGPVTSTGTIVQEQAIPAGRLTLTSGAPVMGSSVTAATTIYYAPFTGRFVPIYNGSQMQLYDFTASANDAVGLSCALGTSWAANSNYDWFIALNGGVPVLGSGPDWSAGAVAGSNAVGASVRGTGAGSTELQIFHGLLTNKNTLTLRISNTTTISVPANQALYVGSTRTGAAGQISFTYGSLAAGGGAANLYVWNAYNQVPITTSVGDNTASWTYSSSTIRPSNNSANNRVNFIQGLAQGGIDASVNHQVRLPSVIGAGCRTGLALNSTTTVDRVFQGTQNASTGVLDVHGAARMAYGPQLGANFVSSNEFSDGTNTTTYFGNPGNGQMHSLVVTLAM